MDVDLIQLSGPYQKFTKLIDNVENINAALASPEGEKLKEETDHCYF